MPVEKRVCNDGLRVAYLSLQPQDSPDSSSESEEDEGQHAGKNSPAGCGQRMLRSGRLSQETVSTVQ